MKAVAYFAAAAFALGALSVQAQNAPINNSGNRVVVPVFPPAASYYGYPYGYNNTATPAQGFARGLADVIRAEGDYNLSSSAAAVNLSEAWRQGIDNQKKYTQTYFDIRDINRQVFVNDQQRRRGSPEQLIHFAQLGKPKRLSPTELDAVSGEINWPILLTGREFKAQRVQLEKAFAHRAYHGALGAETFLAVLQVTDEMLERLKSDVRYLPSEQYVVAKRFLESLAYEAGQPAA